MTRPIDLVSLNAGPPRAYRIAGATLLTDLDLPVLDPFAAQFPAAEHPPTGMDDSGSPASAADEKLVFDGEGLIVDGPRHVICRASAAGYRLALGGIGEFWIAGDGRRIVETVADPHGDPATRAMAALGAPLVLALALRGTFCLHASVVAHNDTLLAFIGESGAGKSTLARYLGREGGVAWRRIIDDTLPVAPIKTTGPATALPHFPQLKLPDESQPPRLVAERRPLGAVYLLDSRGEAISIAPLRRSEAALTLAAHTVGSRLFGRALLAGHMDFCGGLAATLPICRLDYPRRFDALPDVRDALAAVELA